MRVSTKMEFLIDVNPKFKFYQFNLNIFDIKLLIFIKF